MLDNSEFKILIVDDEIFNIEVVLGFLEEEEYTLSYNTNSKKALARVFEEKFDLILLDINMPHMDGLEVCKRIKADKDTQDIPIIFLSAFNDTQTITKAFSYGAVDYITKPFNGLELIARVKTHIQLRKYIRELKIRQEKLAHIASTDLQTGLPNRLRFVSILKKEMKKVIENPSRLSMAYIKIDNLDKLSTLYGYKNGDKIITGISKTLTEILRNDFSVARIFTADFLFLMPNTSLEAAKSIIKKLLNTIRSNKYINIHITCSIGIGEYHLNEEYDKYIDRVEKQMQTVSKDGGDMIAYAPTH